MIRILYITLIGILLSFTFSTDYNKTDNGQDVTGINIGNKAPELDFKDPNILIKNLHLFYNSIPTD